MTLTEFLLARIAEDEANIDGDWTEGYGLHIISWRMHDRLVAEVAAKRRIIDECTHVSGQERRPTSTPGRYDVVDVRSVNAGGHDDSADCEAILHALALPYADHPDYDEAWRIEP